MPPLVLALVACRSDTGEPGWTLRTVSGRVFTARHVIFGVGYYDYDSGYVGAHPALWQSPPSVTHHAILIELGLGLPLHVCSGRTDLLGWFCREGAGRVTV